MTSRERVLAAINFEPVDRAPVSFWRHNYARENSAQDLADETVNFVRDYRLDIAKIQVRYTCFAECWGGVWEPSTHSATEPTLVKPPIASIKELEDLDSVFQGYGPLEEQLRAIRLIRAELGDSVPIIMTVFSPLMIFRRFFSEVPDTALSVLKERPELAAHVLQKITDVVAAFSSDCISEGADGIFYTVNLATPDYLTIDQVRRFQRPFDLEILSRSKDAPINILHLCGRNPYVHEFTNYPASLLSWDIDHSSVSLHDGQVLFGKAMVGGISAKPSLKNLSTADVVSQVDRAIEDCSKLGLIIGPGCSIDYETPAELLHAVRQRVLAITS